MPFVGHSRGFQRYILFTRNKPETGPGTGSDKRPGNHRYREDRKKNFSIELDKTVYTCYTDFSAEFTLEKRQVHNDR